MHTQRLYEIRSHHMEEAPVSLQLCYGGHVSMGSLKGRPRSILQAAGFFVFLY